MILFSAGCVLLRSPNKVWDLKISFEFVAVKLLVGIGNDLEYLDANQRCNAFLIPNKMETVITFARLV